MDNEERIEMLQEAQELLREAIELIKAATEGSPSEAEVNNYLIPAIATRIDSESDWLSADRNLQQIIDAIGNDADEDDTEDAEPVDGFDDENPDWFDLAHRGKSMDSPDVYGDGA